MKAVKEKELFGQLYNHAAELGFPLYVVGGYVRDLLLGHAGKDIDFVLVGDAMRFAGHLKKQLKIKNIVRYSRFGTFMASFQGYNLEFVNARKESYASDSRKPDTQQADLLTDLSRRDFTINTLAMDISPQNFGQIIDVYDGQKDLKDGVIRTPLDPDRTFSDDPLRMMRAVRFAARFGFEIEEQTFQSIQKNAARLSIISMERIKDELEKIIAVKKPSTGLNLLERCGLFEQFLPETAEMKGVEQREDHHHKDVFYHTLQVVDNIARSTDKTELKLAAFFHDIAKPRTKKFIEGTGWTFHGHEVIGERMSKAILKRLKYSNETIQYVAKLVRLHLRPMALVNDEVTDSAIRRLLFLAGDDLDDLMLLCRADITSKNPVKVKRYLSNYDMLVQKISAVEERDRIRNFQPPVDGLEIMQLFNAQPGPLIGRVKKFIEEAILEGKVANDHDACIDLILKNKERFS